MVNSKHDYVKFKFAISSPEEFVLIDSRVWQGCGRKIWPLLLTSNAA